MSRFASGFFASISAVLFLGCDPGTSLEPAAKPGDPMLAKGGGGSGGSEWAVRTALPPLQGGAHGEAYAVNKSGSLVAGYSWDKAGLMQAVTWKRLNGVWTVSALPFGASATSAQAIGINEQNDVGGTFFPASSPRVVLWHSAGGFTVLGCGDNGRAYGMSSGGQAIVGVDRTPRPGIESPGIAAVWRPGVCRVELPPLFADSFAIANAVNADASIVGGAADVGDYTVPVRWRLAGGIWQIQQLDNRSGGVNGANSVGDLVGYVQVPCSSGSCSRGMIWYATGGSRELPTLGGETTSPRAINSVGEVVGLSTLSSDGNGVPFFWSPAVGIRQLPVANGAWAFAISDVRADGTRLIVGAGGRPFSALSWVVKP